ncbi:FkbM family methyltransferase [Rhizobium leguminosarum]|uniref:Methyltransferase FkbM family n=2 Tax=Rhizobium leguminosarum TaxID=384 RepID=A0ABF7QP81_RHILW|nr:FkbM family methyltransferase [Rhizobium leguminosarum]ACI55944.1 methyltransferase FkbM family [Rhizobium leguminosarum bv. trifolii WSM2304]NYJ11640.1 FkbM family methyltransferase [Rhizobium leguminosarum]
MLHIANIAPSRFRLWTRALREWRHGEPELRILDKLCRRSQTAIDIGANYGVYSWFLTKYARDVVAFEPQPNMVAFLKAALGSSVRVEQVALSDSAGVATMRIPSDHFMDGCATIEEQNTLSTQNVEEISVPTRRLDSYQFGPVGFIKIDVEGHELKVLEGAEAILSRDRPNLLIEAEERHRPNAIASVIDYLKPFGYSVYCLKDRKFRLLSIDEVRKDSAGTAYNYVFSLRVDL